MSTTTLADDPKERKRPPLRGRRYHLYPKSRLSEGKPRDQENGTSALLPYRPMRSRVKNSTRISSAPSMPDVVEFSISTIPVSAPTIPVDEGAMTCNIAEPEPKETHQDAESTEPTNSPDQRSVSRFAGFKTNAMRILKNAWFLKSVGVVGAEVASAVLLVYCFVFLHDFETFGHATSYFPWSWGVVYTDAASFANVFSIGFVLSLLLLIISGATLHFRLIPRYRSSLLQSSLAKH
jgi:hypothetical protein